LLTQCGQEDRLNEVRLAMSHEYFNKLNFVMYQLYSEILFKQVKHSTIFAQVTDSDGFGKIIMYMTFENSEKIRFREHPTEVFNYQSFVN
jgi:hypothetical protein